MANQLVDKLTRAGLNRAELAQSKTRQLVWAHDASHFRIVPGATIRAKDADQIAKILAAATESSIPVTFRSGGSSLSGQTVGSGLVIDTRSAFLKLKEIGPEFVTAEPGVTLSRLNGHLGRSGRKVGPDPASLVASTLGGAVSNNSSGMTCGTKLNSYATIQSAKIIFADGTKLYTAAVDAAEKLRQMQPAIYELLASKRDQIRSNPDQVAKIREIFSLKNTMGYGINAFLDFDEPLDILLHLLVGSEGTLAFMSEITLRTIEVASLRRTSLMLFSNLRDANQMLTEIIDCEPAAIELMDGTSLAALKSEGVLPAGLTESIQADSAAILVEFESSNESNLEEQLRNFEQRFESNLVFHGTDGELRNQLWSMRKGLYAIVAKNRPPGTTALLEDVAVPPKHLTRACEELGGLCEEHGYGKPVIFGHVRDGNIHFMISDDFSSPERVAVFESFTEQMVTLILSLGGNLKAEHGTGRAMAPFVERQFGSELYQIMLEIKHAFDPKGILNPGVIFPRSARDWLENLKPTSQVSEIVDSCVECGYCESSCPSSGLTLTPRERIVAFRELAGADQLAKKDLESELGYQADQTCATDGMCAVNCPVGINTGTFVKELRQQSNSATVERIGEIANNNWSSITGAARVGLKLASALAPLARSGTRLLAKIAPQSTIPQWDSHVKSDGFSRKKLIGGSSNFVFLPSCMNEIFGEPELSKLLAVASWQGVELEVPDDAAGFCCGTPFTSKGLAAASGTRTSRNSKLLAGLTDRLLVIDGSSCHQTLLGQADQPVIELTQFIAEHLLNLPVKRRVPRIVLHPTCSGEKTGSNRAMEQIARHIADEVVVPTDWKCCGFAGDRGLLVPELTANATTLEAQEVSQLDAVFVSNNQPCQIGMSGATSRDYRSIVAVWLESVS